jgi:hypothetical protein
MPEFKFELTMAAAKKNYLMLGKYYFDLAAAIAANKTSPMGYGSEFRKPDVLQPLLSMHPLWLKLEDILTNGVQYPLKPLEEELRVKDLKLALEFGNHKGALNKPDLLGAGQERHCVRLWNCLPFQADHQHQDPRNYHGTNEHLSSNAPSMKQAESSQKTDSPMIKASASRKSNTLSTAESARTSSIHACLAGVFED